MSETNYSKVLFSCMLMSFLALIFLTFLAHNNEKWMWVPVPVGLAPLVYYHWFFLTPRIKKGRDYSAIDSVYYFGFLITIAALGISAASLAVDSTNQNNFTHVAFQFGLGLLATGYAVFARMHLSTIATDLSDEDQQQVTAQQVTKTRELILNIESISLSMTNLAETIFQRTQNFIQNLQEQVSQNLYHSSAAFQSSVENILKNLDKIGSDLGVQIASISDPAEWQGLNKNLKTINKTFSNFNDTMSNMEDSTRKCMQIGGEISDVLLKTGQFASELHSGLERINPALMTLSDGVGKTSEKMTGFEKILNDGSNSLAKAAHSMSEFSNSSSDICDANKKINEYLDSLGKSIEGSQNLSEKNKILAQDFQGLTILLKDLSGNIRAFNHSLHEQVTTHHSQFSDATQKLKHTVDNANLATEKLLNGFIKIVEEIIALSRQPA